MLVGIVMAVISALVVTVGVVLIRRPDLRERTRDQPAGFRQPSALETRLVPYGFVIVGLILFVTGIVTAATA